MNGGEKEEKKPNERKDGFNVLQLKTKEKYIEN